jgi:hypothetical protein
MLTRVSSCWPDTAPTVRYPSSPWSTNAGVMMPPYSARPARSSASSPLVRTQRLRYLAFPWPIHTAWIMPSPSSGKE